MTSGWQNITIGSVEEVFRSLVTSDVIPENAVYHGAVKGWDSVRSSLDVSFDRSPSIPADQRVKLETSLLHEFVEQSWVHLLPGAKKHAEFARLRWGTHRNSGAIFVGRHYGLPTRCIDWTEEALVGLFFACRRFPREDGVVWWMARTEFEECLAAQWPRVYGKPGDITDDFERRLSREEDHDVIVQLFFPPWMPRAVAQKAFVTMAGRLGVCHDEAIWNLGVRACGRLTIPAALKADVLSRLDQMGINGYTLEIGDSTVETIASDLTAEFDGVL